MNCTMASVYLVVFIFLLIVVVTTSSNVSPILISTKEYHKLQDKHGTLLQKDALICTLFGFIDDKIGRELQDFILETVASVNEPNRQVYAFESNSHDEGVTSNLLFAYIPQRRNLEQFIVKMQQLIDLSSRAESPIHIVLISNSRFDAKAELNKIFTWDIDDHLKIDYVDSSLSEEEISEIIKKAVIYSFGSSSLTKLHTSNEVSTLTQMQQEDSASIERLSTIYQALSKAIRNEFKEMNSQLNYVDFNQTIGAVEDLMELVSTKLSDELESAKLPEKLLVDRLQVLVDSEMKQLLDRMVIAHKDNCAELLVRRLPKIPPTSYRSVAAKLLQQILRRHQEFVEVTNTKFAKLSFLDFNSAADIRNNGKDSKTNAKTVGHANVFVKASTKGLKKMLEEKIHEREDFMVIQGLINPFIRTFPFPPTHINFNYLINPRAMYAMKEFNGLYDEHRDGFVPNRADPLEFRGVASTPFDPNLTPTPREKADPWWVTVKEFFLND